MQTIILCGGKGTRLHEETEYRPKPLVRIGGMPILLHIMQIYARHGHKDFVLALGYKGWMIKEYFFNLDRNMNDVTLDTKSGDLTLLSRRHRYDYRVSFIDTGQNTDTAQRVLKAASFIPDDEFMISYGDDVSNVNLDKMLAFHSKKKDSFDAQATLTAVHPSSKYGQLSDDQHGMVKKFDEKPMMREYINGGFMVFTRKALKQLKKGETLEDGLTRLASKKKLAMYRHEGFWHAMNTMKDVEALNELWKRGKPWVK